MQQVKDDKLNQTQNVDSCEDTIRSMTCCKLSTSNTLHSPQNNNTILLRLQYLANKYGDFKVAKSWKNKEGEILWSKHRSVLECWESEWGLNWLKQVSHRQILPCEIVIDLDDNPTIEKLNWICDKLDIYDEDYIAYFTGSKGYHIHIKDKKLITLTNSQRENVRLNLINALKGDTHKKDPVLIALEDVPHWKTGKLKTEIRRSRRWENF